MLTKLTGLLLVFGAVSAVITYTALGYFFSVKRQDYRQLHQEQFAILLEQNLKDFVRAGRFLSTETGVKWQPATGAVGLAKVIDEYWSVLRHDYSVEKIQFFDLDNRAIASWGLDIGGSKKQPLPEGLLRDLAETLEPKPYFLCTLVCNQYAGFPMWIDGALVGTLVFSSPLAQTAHYFRDIVGAEIGVVNEKNLQFPDPYFDIPNSTLKFSAVTDFLKWSAILERYPELFQEVVKGTVRQISYNSLRYEFSLLPVSFREQELPFTIAMLEPIDSELLIISNVTQAIIYISIAGTLLALFIVFWVLNRPLTELKTIATALPLLGDKKFKQLRTTIGFPHDTSIDNELTLVHRTVYGLSERLETLENDVERSTNTLIETLAKQEREAEFVNRLLDNAQVIITTHNMEGGIRTVNRFGLNTMGYRSEEILKKPFDNVFSYQSRAETAMENVNQQLALAEETIFQETQILTKTEQLRDIVWAHCRIADVKPETSLVLSVGLDITERKKAEEHIAYIAEHDELTGLLNRSKFRHHLTSHLAGNQPGILCYIDLNHFKLVNDTYGHVAGDLVLGSVTSLLHGCFPPSAVIGRLGGDEFAVLLSGCNTSHAIAGIKHLNDEIGNLKLDQISAVVPIHASAGIVEFQGSGNDVDTLMHHADCAMYEIKGSANKFWHVYTGQESMLNYLQESVWQQGRTEEALEQGRLLMYYQPVCSLKTSQVMGFEALVRMMDESGKLVAPDEFIPMAEKSGQVKEIDRFVVRQVLQDYKILSVHFHNPTLHINFSALSFGDSLIAEYLSKELVRSNVSATNLVIEVTETAALGDMEKAKDCARLIQSLGCQLAVDDFGTGFGSLTYLSKFPVNKVKIDTSFIVDLQDNPDNLKLVKAIREFSNNLGKVTVAEGVENQETLELLCDIGIDQVQGYYLGGPKSLSELLALHGASKEK